MKQKFLPETNNIALTNTSSIEKRMNELFEAMKNNSICYGKVIYCENDAKYLLVDLGFGITGLILKTNIAVEGRYSAGHSLIGQIINFKVESFNEEKNCFLLNRSAVQIEAKQWQYENYQKGDIIEAKVTNIYENGILVDIGGGVQNFIPPRKLSEKFVKDINSLFYKGQLINIKIDGFDDKYNNWSLDYINCPQFGFSVNSTYAVSIDKKKEDHSWYCSLLFPKLKGILLIKGNTFNINIGDIEKATIVGFKKGVPLLKVI